MLKLTKKGDKYWLFEDSQIGLFSPSKFTINLELNEIVIVYENGLKSKRYNVSDCEIYDLGELTPFTTSSGDLFMQKLEELNCPCFQKNENIFNITGGSWAELTDFDSLNDATLPLSGTEEIPIVQGGETKKVAVSEFGGSTPNLQQVTDVGNTTNKGIELNTEDGLALDFSDGAIKQANLNATSLAFSFYSYISTFFANFYYNGLTANRDYLLPNESGTIATREWTNANKQDTLVSATNIKTINGNSVLGSGDLDTKIQNYFTFSTNTTLTDAHHNAVIWVTATCNITIASGLRSDFNCTFRTFAGVTATFLTSGTTINAESDGDVQAEKTMSYLAQYTTNNYILSGGGLS